MKNADIKKLNAGDLQNKLTELKAEYLKTKLAHRISPVENPIQIRDLRRTIARLETELSAKQQ
ncbi:50S ribosomal protein L29 [Chryseobacterium lacus]|uniref:Large ribosomal subunit protein uL29 n=1 Tax=Chryseobacterium lacus TaxID=2058346 RepID=A0A368N484_9FLAO|nr:50S ribosomal protein L29 [Chryseobacterium lacus]MBF6610532.1 50S ribosomal protein L29 [Chryseobacterium sp.]ODS80831.1 MAG: 50S ribosomal protein L29 [Chryseobacterium sp. SCN 40-13]RCU44863.1 50S ribosomal protein L29 [Chryseobacterium lacus]RST29214.1 50S ribosomal protein L29 [Chryseobacterium lacus]RST32530.1 50S ribosomal protein L29 [Chryseobacterium lacus]